MVTDGNFYIVEADGDKKRYLSLLLEGDESEAMIDRYIADGTLYVGMLGDVPIAVCVVLNLDADTVEVKNLAVDANYRRQGVGRRMLAHVESQSPANRIVLGTGETPSTLRFYESCGYSYSHRIPDFFATNYPEPIIEEGVTLKDMIYLVKNKRADNEPEIVRCDPMDYPLLAAIWERSVRASHDFLSENVIAEIKAALEPDYFPNVDLYAASVNGRKVGFVGLSDVKIEMLFVDADCRGRGFGSALVDFAKRTGAVAVDVNEQNRAAYRFYMAHGFNVIARDDTDDAGRPYPILHLGL